MIKKIRLLLDYGCYPVWLYDYKNRIVNTILPDELRNDIALDNKFSLLQEQYNNLFINTSTEFKFIGFKTKKDKENFIEDWDNAVTELKNKIGKKIEIIDDVCNVFDTLFPDIPDKQNIS